MPSAVRRESGALWPDGSEGPGELYRSRPAKAEDRPPAHSGDEQTARTGGSIDPSTDAYAKVVDIPDTDGPGATPRGELIQLASGDLWGQAVQDGGDGEDSSFSFRYTLTSGSPTLTTFPVAREKGFGNAWPELTEVDVADQLRAQ